MSAHTLSHIANEAAQGALAGGLFPGMGSIVGLVLATLGGEIKSAQDFALAGAIFGGFTALVAGAGAVASTIDAFCHPKTPQL